MVHSENNDLLRDPIYGYGVWKGCLYTKVLRNPLPVWHIRYWGSIDGPFRNKNVVKVTLSFIQLHNSINI